MLGEHHALSGLVTGAAAGEYVMHLPPAGTAALAALTAGWATVPDLDTCGSCAARSLGFLSEMFAWTVGKIARGHRHGTHSLLGVAVMTAVTWLACEYRAAIPGRAALALLLAIALAAGLRALRLGGHAADLLAIGAAAGVAWYGWDLPMIPLACGLGCLTHIAGDMLTDSGCPLAWPASGYRFKWWPEPFAFTTGTRPESLVALVLTAALGLLAWHAVASAGIPIINHAAGG
jgi:membrane-bound metal-dependent hydrolase YbcI (DUF457 family)